ncbi:hypothetical protein Pan216_38180 [Planctomycetes bacterium Pan216]|uniref:Uncharacterized protein n=1 Tax=Kolteria novifilia TaxID=2527975 RepID=A0A518B7J3_9BACT|nr:hypothetical protein Pan216_38180 [Planctomycetes bacterium Pan216]
MNVFGMAIFGGVMGLVVALASTTRNRTIEDWEDELELMRARKASKEEIQAVERIIARRRDKHKMGVIWLRRIAALWFLFTLIIGGLMSGVAIFLYMVR